MYNCTSTILHLPPTTNKVDEKSRHQACSRYLASCFNFKGCHTFLSKLRSFVLQSSSVSQICNSMSHIHQHKQLMQSLLTVNQFRIFNSPLLVFLALDLNPQKTDVVVIRNLFKRRRTKTRLQPQRNFRSTGQLPSTLSGSVGYRSTSWSTTEGQILFDGDRTGTSIVGRPQARVSYSSACMVYLSPVAQDCVKYK